MKKIIACLLAATVSLFNLNIYGQQKKSAVKKTGTVKSISKTIVTEPSFAGLISLEEIKDINPGETGYDALRMLAENYHVPLAYSDKTFRGKNALRRGEFIVHFNSALESIRNFMDSMKYDTSLINTYDKHASYITEAKTITDLNAKSVYYPAVQSMIESWGIAAMFTKSRLLRASSSINEEEVYDIIRVTMGYENAGVSKKPLPIKREAFAIMLSEAISQLRQRVLRLPKPVPDVVSDTLYIKLPYDTLKK